MKNTKTVWISAFRNVVPVEVVITAFIMSFSNLSTSGIVQFIFGIALSSAFTLYLGYVMRKIYKNRFK
ncbi:hypothetical protein [Clostridium pasteurianum]|uniref:Uncharacterized protein n=1 Tax=Clostridium pasteurianum BC1 TaxID=86416 RepID=R4K1A9_CLOPA|nr:hypothetical protein [Clostridium pasteurianum]AGK95521.1 hypothetical protein Clopa_0466 [Clostridium pasteurianum BC1]